jgi:hypothetical protein
MAGVAQACLQASVAVCWADIGIGWSASGVAIDMACGPAPTAITQAAFACTDKPNDARIAARYVTRIKARSIQPTFFIHSRIAGFAAPAMIKIKSSGAFVGVLAPKPVRLLVQKRVLTGEGPGARSRRSIG